MSVWVCPPYDNIHMCEFILSSLHSGVSMFVGDAVKAYGTHERRKRNVIGITPWGLIENHNDLIGRDVSLIFS